MPFLRNHILPCLLCCLLPGFLGACHHDDDEPEENRTVLVYMMAENNLSEDAIGVKNNGGNIGEMIEGMAGGIGKGNNLVVYVDPRGLPPALIRITEHGRDTIRSYAEQNSISPEIMRGVIDEVIRKFPASSYGLILWSHGNGWLPASAADRYVQIASKMNPMSMQDIEDKPLWDVRDPYAVRSADTRAFGVEGNVNWMEIDELVSALPSHTFDFIMFDACFMASTEVVYALKEKADYIVGSAIEILARGFPYDEITRLLFQHEPHMKVAKGFFNFYNRQSGSSRSGAIAVIDTKYLDLLAEKFSALVSGKADQIASFDISGIQILDRAPSHNHFDLGDFAGHIAGEDQAALAEFQSALDKAVPYKASTPSLLNRLFINTYSGLNVYIPLSAYADLNVAYRQTPWSVATGFGQEQ
ncbi:MAG: hypothetical protein K6F98_08055 [Bacteroidales bacterium]|nr:hypothetical protein [Bacteroidales bacterium]